ncbi:siderophore-iron reductase FhuF [Salinisphaera sp. T31B1]|uniref:siderophore-iron reductase FhuF n=1 Tax=Salinisphaera sp. T31B1 TaxID=727963 RepID=UPI00334057AE
MVAALYPSYFHDNLAGFADALRPAAWDPATVPMRRLIEPASLSERLACFSAAHDTYEPRAAASQWSKWFFSRLGIATLVAQLGSGRALPLTLDGLALASRDDGTPAYFRLADTPGTAHAGHDLSALIDEVFTPVVNALSAHCRLAPRVFWSNASTYIAWALDELDRQAQAPRAPRIAVRDLLSRRDRPDGGFNPFYRAYKRCPPGTMDGDGRPVDQCRRLCCMRDLDARWDLCANCPRAMRFPVLERASG